MQRKRGGIVGRYGGGDRDNGADHGAVKPLTLYYMALALIAIMAVCAERLADTTAGVITIFAVIGVAQLLVGAAGR